MSLRYVCWLPHVRNLMLTRGRELRKKELGQLLASEGINLTFKQLSRSYKQLLDWHFGSEADHFRMLPSYVDGLRAKGHFAVLKKDATERFQRLVIVYRESVQAFKLYAMRGLQLDGTFLKSSFGGVLLVACFRDANNNIRILAISVVSGETEANWRSFIEAIKETVCVMPGFIISDRDKGLSAAVAAVYPGVHHAACMRHLMENFNKKFKERPLKKLAWSLARATTVEEFKEAETGLMQCDKAIKWLRDVS